MVKNKHGTITYDAGFACNVVCKIHSSYKKGGREESGGAWSLGLKLTG